MRRALVPAAALAVLAALAGCRDAGAPVPVREAERVASPRSARGSA